MNGRFTMNRIENRKSKIGNLSLNCTAKATALEARVPSAPLLFKLLPLNKKLSIFDYQFSILLFLGRRIHLNS